MSDQAAGPRKSPENDDIDELPSESAPSGADAGGLSLEEQIAQLADLEIEEQDTGKG